jgi:hypothetical protein
VLPALGLALLAGHAVVLRHASARPALSPTALLGVVVLVLVKHLGLVDALRRLRRRRSPRR